jgi:Zn-dependent protease
VTKQHIIFYGCLVVAVILHEISHGVVAYAYGDDTAKRAGRLTLNPIPHIDPLGSIILPAMAVLANLPVLGWAKPVPVNPARLRNPRRQMLIVGLAGPVTNFGLMVAAAIPAKIVLAGTYPGACTGNLVDPRVSLTGDILASFAVVNLLLGLFNLLPIPPLDGGRIVVGLLPLELARRWARLERVGILVVIVVVFLLPHIIQGFDPFGQALDTVVPWAINLLLRLAGHDIGGADVRI